MIKLLNRKYFFLFIFLILLFVSVICYMRAPSNTVISIPKYSASESAKTLFTLENYPGPYLTFSYPSAFILDQITELESGFLSKVVLNSRDFYAKRMIVTLVNVSAATIDEIPAVQYRRLPESGYEESVSTHNNLSWLIFLRKAETYEQIAFFLQDQLLYTIAFTSSLNAPHLDEDLLTVLDSLSKL